MSNSLPWRQANPPQLVQGQHLWRVSRGYRHNAELQEEAVLVQHLGRKYFTVRPVGEERDWADSTHFLEDWREKSNYSARCSLFPSQHDYQETVLRLSLYEAVRNMLPHNCPPELTLPEVQHLHRFLIAALDPNKKLPGSENTT